MNVERFNEMVDNFLEFFVSSFHTGPLTTRLGVLLYSNYDDYYIPFDSFHHLVQLLEKIRDIGLVKHLSTFVKKLKKIQTETKE